MKELQPRGPFLERKMGTNESYVTHYELAPEVLRELNTHAGKFVEVWVKRQHWIYQGPDDEEDYVATESHAYGTLLEAKPDGLIMEVIAGETKYGNSSAAVAIPTGKEQYPYYRHQFALKRHAEISEIERLNIGDQAFQWGEPSGAEQKELSA